MKDVHSRTGGFDTVRLLAALMVFHSHAYALNGQNQPSLPGGAFGGIAVTIFFVVSGYWVTQSALQRSTVSYVVARALRIVPGLAVCCAISIVACALASSIPVNDYLRSPKTWQFMWNAAPFFHTPVMGAPGLFEDGPVKDAINGSLWTLRYEVMCYVLVGLAAVFGPKGVRIFMVAAAIFSLAVIAQLFGVGPTALNERYIVLLDFLQVSWIATFAACFAFGAWLHQATDRRLVQAIAVSAVAMFLGLHDPTFNQMVAIFLYGSIAVWVGRNLNLDRHITRGQDLSYGVYIYAFPCQQLAVRWIRPTDDASFVRYYLVALGATVALAALSWMLVERPALLLKHPFARGIERLLAKAMGAWPRRRGSGQGLDLPETAGGLAFEVDAVDSHPVRRGGVRY